MTELNELEQQLEDTKAIIARGQMAEKLANNREFRKLILDGFCTDEVVRNVNASGEPNLSPQARADCTEMARAGGHLRRYLSSLVTMGRVAAKNVPELEEQIALERAEEDLPAETGGALDTLVSAGTDGSNAE